MSKKRVRVTGPLLRSLAEAESALARLREVTIHRDQTQLILERRRKELDEEYGAQITEDQQEIDALAEQLRVWADASPAVFGTKKSLELMHGVIGWRVGNPTLKTRTGWTWDRVLEALRDAGFFNWVRTKSEVDKQAILANREHITEETMRLIGVRVVQDEPFFIEPKIESAERVKEGA